jgi:hypothetical protein
MVIYIKKCVKKLNKIFYPNLETELNNHLTDSLMSIFINVSTDDTKYLIFYEEYERNDLNTDQASSQDDQNSENARSNSKRAKLDYDAFTQKLKSFYLLI